MKYNFKAITTVPDAKGVIDIVLSETQRRTPTQVHPQFKISRIRSFYMRKVKYCQQAFQQKFVHIVSQFPRIDVRRSLANILVSFGCQNIHPFYSHLCNVLYDRDHYKLALGHVDAVRRVVDKVAKDYLRLLKYADSPYKCKMLKRAALGRMCTAVKKLQSPFVYLEEVRQHLSRLPCIDPNARTLILTGFPNVGKSSFMNLVTNANVEVQPYAFTTRSLYVGHFDFAYVRWQLLDTPGILDHPLVNRNTIELTAITALAYLKAAIIYIVDISEECGFTIENQVALFQNIKALFENKPLVIVYNKTDKVKFEDLPLEKQELLNSMTQCVDSERIAVTSSSCLIASGVDEAKNQACEMLLQQRIENSLDVDRRDDSNDCIVDCSTEPKKLSIPSTVREELRKKHLGLTAEASSRAPLSKELEELHGGPGVYSIDLNKEWQLEDPQWQYDIMPEIIDGRNVLDYVDPDIEQKLIELEKEEAEYLAKEEESQDAEDCDEIDWLTTSAQLDRLMRKIQLRRIDSRLKKNRTRVAKLPRPVKGVTSEQLSKVAIKSLKIPAKKRTPLKKLSSTIPSDPQSFIVCSVPMMDDDDDGVKCKALRKSRYVSKTTIDSKQTPVVQAIARHRQRTIDLGKVARDATIEHYRKDMGRGKQYVSLLKKSQCRVVGPGGRC